MKMINYNVKGTVRLYWNKMDARQYGLLINEVEPPEREPELNAYLSGMSQFGVPKEAIGVYTPDLTKDTDIALVDSVIKALEEEYQYFAFVRQTPEGEYDGFFVSEIKPDPFATFNLDDLAWELPENIDELRLNVARENKLHEIRAAALDAGRAGAKIIGCVDPYLSYHMALTPDDVTYLQLANTVAKMEADMLGTDHKDATAEIKEKWLENGVEKTRLHKDVPLPVHDAVLLQAVLQAAEISRRLEGLIQAMGDAGTSEEVGKINWNTSLEVA